jgi:hypothetical protein
MSACFHDHRDLTVIIGGLRVALREQWREVQRLRVGTEVLREATGPLIHHATARERFAFVDRLRGRFGVRRPCRILVTDHSDYHAWVRANARRDERRLGDRELIVCVVEIHTTRPACGAERVTRELKRQGVEVGRRPVARLMREYGVAGTARRERRTPTEPDGAAAAVPELLRRELTSPMPGSNWLETSVASRPTRAGSTWRRCWVCAARS